MTEPVVLPVKSVRNPRDLGGYIGFGGHKIKSHRLLRTGNISKIIPKDKKFLLDYGLTKIIDLRSPAECKANPDQKIPDVDHYEFPLSVDDNTGGNGLDVSIDFEHYRHDQYAGFYTMCQRYHDHVSNKFSQNSISQIINLIAATTEGTVLYHCSEGKDRTGLVTVILLYILGVDLETIRQDYLYSNLMLNDYRRVRDEQFKRAGENDKFRANMRILGSVANAYIDTSLITINENYGDIDSYIDKQLGIDEQMQEKIRENYLEK